MFEMMSPFKLKDLENWVKWVTSNSNIEKR